MAHSIQIEGTVESRTPWLLDDLADMAGLDEELFRFYVIANVNGRTGALLVPGATAIAVYRDGPTSPWWLHLEDCLPVAGVSHR